MSSSSSSDDGGEEGIDVFEWPGDKRKPSSVSSLSHLHLFSSSASSSSSSYSSSSSSFSSTASSSAHAPKASRSSLSGERSTAYLSDPFDDPSVPPSSSSFPSSSSSSSSFSSSPPKKQHAFTTGTRNQNPSGGTYAPAGAKRPRNDSSLPPFSSPHPSSPLLPDDHNRGSAGGSSRANRMVDLANGGPGGKQKGRRPHGSFESSLPAAQQRALAAQDSRQSTLPFRRSLSPTPSFEQVGMKYLTDAQKAQVDAASVDPYMAQLDEQRHKKMKKKCDDADREDFIDPPKPSYHSSPHLSEYSSTSSSSSSFSFMHTQGGNTYGKYRSTYHYTNPSSSSSSSPSFPSSPPSSSNMGFKNIGNTCYMNACLQSLLSIRPFVSDLTNPAIISPSPTALSSPLPESSFYSSLVKIVNQRKEKGFTVDTRQLKEAFGSKYKRFAGYQQQDAHEFLTECLNHLTEDIAYAQREKKEKEEKTGGNKAVEEKVKEEKGEDQEMKIKKEQRAEEKMNTVPPSNPLLASALKLISSPAKSAVSSSSSSSSSSTLLMQEEEIRIPDSQGETLALSSVSVPPSAGVSPPSPSSFPPSSIASAAVPLVPSSPASSPDLGFTVNNGNNGDVVVDVSGNSPPSSPRLGPDAMREEMRGEREREGEGERETHKLKRLRRLSDEEDKENRSTNTSVSSSPLSFPPHSPRGERSVLNVDSDSDREEHRSSSSPPPPPLSHADVQQAERVSPSFLNFHIEITYTLTCTAFGCGQRRDTVENFNILSIDLPEDVRREGALLPRDFPLPQLLHQFFMPSSRELKCPREGCGGTHVKVIARVTRLPRVLILHIKRFKPISSGGVYRYTKLKDHVNIDRLITLGKWCDEKETVVPTFPAVEENHQREGEVEREEERKRYESPMSTTQRRLNFNCDERKREYSQSEIDAVQISPTKEARERERAPSPIDCCSDEPYGEEEKRSNSHHRMHGKLNDADYASDADMDRVKAIIAEQEKEEKERREQEEDPDLAAAMALSRREADEWDERQKARTGHAYKLKAIIQHRGETAGSGHYIADIARSTSSSSSSSSSSYFNDWRRYDDSWVRAIDLEEALKEGRRNGYILFYELKLQRDIPHGEYTQLMDAMGSPQMKEAARKRANEKQNAKAREEERKGGNGVKRTSASNGFSSPSSFSNQPPASSSAAVPAALSIPSVKSHPASSSSPPSSLSFPPSPALRGNQKNTFDATSPFNPANKGKNNAPSSSSSSAPLSPHLTPSPSPSPSCSPSSSAAHSRSPGIINQLGQQSQMHDNQKKATSSSSSSSPSACVPPLSASPSSSSSSSSSRQLSNPSQPSAGCNQKKNHSPSQKQRQYFLPLSKV